MPRRLVHEIEKQREALSLRGIERAYGYSRAFVAELVRNREIPAAPRGHATCILRSDFELWMRSHSAAVAADTAHVEQLLARESRRAGAG